MTPTVQLVSRVPEQGFISMRMMDPLEALTMALFNTVLTM